MGVRQRSLSSYAPLKTVSSLLLSFSLPTTLHNNNQLSYLLLDVCNGVDLMRRELVLNINQLYYQTKSPSD